MGAYEVAKVARDAVEDECKAASEALQVFPTLANGLTTEAVKFSPEYMAAKAKFDKAFARQRSVNAWFVKTFKKEYLAERAERGR